jgi:hypothetical protein
VLKDVLLLMLALPAVIAIFRGRGILPSSSSHPAHSQAHHDEYEMYQGSGEEFHNKHHHNPQEGDSNSSAASCDCGKNTTEAKALGCRYDPFAAAWLPERCRDDELIDEFEREGDNPDGGWLYWADGKRKQSLTVDEVAALADTPDERFYATQRWHVMHCLFYWRKEHRFRFMPGKTLEGRTDGEHHIKHCSDVILNPTFGSRIGVVLNSAARHHKGE